MICVFFIIHSYLVKFTLKSIAHTYNQKVSGDFIYDKLYLDLFKNTFLHFQLFRIWNRSLKLFKPRLRIKFAGIKLLENFVSKLEENLKMFHKERGAYKCKWKDFKSSSLYVKLVALPQNEFEKSNFLDKVGGVVENFWRKFNIGRSALQSKWQITFFKENGHFISQTT